MHKWYLENTNWNSFSFCIIVAVIYNCSCSYIYSFCIAVAGDVLHLFHRERHLLFIRVGAWILVIVRVKDFYKTSLSHVKRQWHLQKKTILNRHFYWHIWSCRKETDRNDQGNLRTSFGSSWSLLCVLRRRKQK